MRIGDQFPSKYLKAADAEEGDLNMTIARIKMEIVGIGKGAENKPVVYFKEHEKGIVLNKTNASMISKIAKSDDTDDWIGVSMRIVAADVEYQGELMRGLRVREPKKLGKPTAGPTDTRTDKLNTDDDGGIPF
jgi:hypothetical protein